MREARRSIFLITAALVAVGIIMIYSASSIYAYSSVNDSLFFLKRHLMYLGVGFALMLLAMVCDLKKLQKFSKPIITTSGGVSCTMCSTNYRFGFWR